MHFVPHATVIPLIVIICLKFTLLWIAKLLLDVYQALGKYFWKKGWRVERWGMIKRWRVAEGYVLNLQCWITKEKNVLKHDYHVVQGAYVTVSF